MTITGSNFNVSIYSVFIGDEPAAVISYTSTQIVIKTPALAPGLYNLIIPCGPLGNAR